ncbi:amidase family protein, partial [uncultured Amnibacterium sp.]|uniref:amidase family protein n=1 Tax=uncultured Amnibacterium sp. TaxID=1631851 RepID=UPI0035CB32F0
MPDEPVDVALLRLPASVIAGRLAEGSVSSEAVTRAHLDRIRAVDPAVHAFLHVADERALDAARDIDRRRAAGDTLGPLAGLPVAIKDVLCTVDMPSTAASRILEGWLPPIDATPVARLRSAGLIPLGKTNMDEFAMGSSTEY